MSIARSRDDTKMGTGVIVHSVHENDSGIMLAGLWLVKTGWWGFVAVVVFVDRVVILGWTATISETSLGPMLEDWGVIRSDS